MKRFLLRGALALAIVIPALWAQPKPKSQAEVDALRAMYSAPTPAARIAAAENVLTKFADTEFKAEALYVEAESYREKGDYANAVVFGERTLEADPKHYRVMLMLATVIAGHTKEFDLDREDKLAQVKKYTDSALELLKTAPKPNPNLTDDQWEAAKKDFAADAHTALGISAMVRKKYDVAETEFKTALDTAAHPDAATTVRLGRAYMDDGKYDDAIAQFDKVMANQEAAMQVRQAAQADRVRAFEKKKAAAKPADALGATPARLKPETPKP